MKQLNHWIPTAVATVALALSACSDSPSGNRTDTSDAAAAMQASAGTSTQSATVGTTVPVAPAVIVRDEGGNVLPGARVSFTVTAGGGSVEQQTATTDAQGVASAGAWRLGDTPGANALQAHVGDLPAVQFNATALAAAPLTPFAVEIRYLATPTARQQQAVTYAINRWQEVITRDLVDIPVNVPTGACWAGQPRINERIDDVLIFVEFIEIDGAGKVLGEAGPCYVRSDNGLPIIGHLKLDAADLRQMETVGMIDDVVMHEIGHVLGIGTLWPDKGLLTGAGTDDPTFVGANAVSAYRTLGGLLAAVPVENTGGAGTRDGHWRESVFGNELMTGWVNRSPNPLSAMTIGSLTDLGYGANVTVASNYTLRPATLGAQSTTGVQLGGREKLKRPKFKVDRKGKQERF